MSEKVLYEAAALDRLVASFFARIQSTGLYGEKTAIIGLRTGGDVLADRFARSIGGSPQVGYLDITLYRDDFAHRQHWPAVQASLIPFSIDGHDVLLVDDVIFTGRTVRAAMDALVDIGRPRAVRLASLIDRGNRELPIQPDCVGEKIDVPRDSLVLAEFHEQTGRSDRVVIKTQQTS